MTATKRLERSMTAMAKESVEVEQISDSVYVWGSELATLRIFAAYQSNGAIHNPKARVGYSKNLSKFYFVLDML